MSERVTHRQNARLGRTMKLPCPVEGDPPPLIMWTKDGRNIHSGWTRFRVLQHALRIKEVETEDAGTYICKATNGFGSVNVNYTLIVIGRRSAEYRNTSDTLQNERFGAKDKKSCSRFLMTGWFKPSKPVSLCSSVSIMCSRSSPHRLGCFI